MLHASGFPNSGINIGIVCKVSQTSVLYTGLPRRGLDLTSRGLDFPSRGLDFPRRGLDFPSWGFDFPRLGLDLPSCGALLCPLTEKF